MWDDIADKDIAEQTFTDSLNHMFDSLLELRQEELIARDRTHGLSSEERRALDHQPGAGEEINDRLILHVASSSSRTQSNVKDTVFNGLSAVSIGKPPTAAQRRSGNNISTPSL
jgi:hypothetical protein